MVYICFRTFRTKSTIKLLSMSKSKAVMRRFLLMSIINTIICCYLVSLVDSVAAYQRSQSNGGCLEWLNINSEPNNKHQIPSLPRAMLLGKDAPPTILASMFAKPVGNNDDDSDHGDDLTDIHPSFFSPICVTEIKPSAGEASLTSATEDVLIGAVGLAGRDLEDGSWTCDVNSNNGNFWVLSRKNRKCDLWWNKLAYDVVPLPPTIWMSGKAPKQGQPMTFLDVGICRVGNQFGVMFVDGGERGFCRYVNEETGMEEYVGGNYFHLAAESPIPDIHVSDIERNNLLSKINGLVEQFITEEDQDNMALITNSQFSELLSGIQQLDGKTLKEVLGMERFYAHDLNIKGLHLLRCLLAERIVDFRRRKLGYHHHPDYKEFMRDGILFRDADTITEKEFHSLLQMISGDSESTPAMEWTVVNVTHMQDDPQYQMHMDTFHAAHKMWVYPDTTTLDDGPLHYVKGSHRNTIGKLRWLYERSLPPAQEAIREPSLRMAENETEYGFEPQIAALPLGNGVRRTLVVADTSGLHHRGRAEPGKIRISYRLSSDSGGLPRKPPFRID